MADDSHWMQEAIAKARQGIVLGQTPFGACIVNADGIVSLAHNSVFATEDITAHAEILAIREACSRLESIDLSGCRIYSTCEPCPMCFAACHWARLDHLYFGAAIEDAAAAGFRELTLDHQMMKQLGGSPIQVTPGLEREACVQLFREWAARPDKKTY